MTTVVALAGWCLFWTSIVIVLLAICQSSSRRDDLHRRLTIFENLPSQELRKIALYGRSSRDAKAARMILHNRHNLNLK